MNKKYCHGSIYVQLKPNSITLAASNQLA